MLTKEKLLQTINDLPDKFSLDDVFDRLILIQKIDLGFSQSEAGQTNTTDQAKDKLKRWLKK